MSHDSAFAINHELRRNGLASLSEAGALISQLAFYVRDHAHFRALLIACEPEERGNMYDALAPNVRFKARPLADYLIEAAQDAERRQLPIMGEDGHFKEFKSPEIRSSHEALPAPARPTDAAIATNAVAEAVAKERLHVVCVLCTREDFFRGVTRQEAVEEARGAGWRAGFKRVFKDSIEQNAPESEREQVEVCPRCVKARAPRMRAA